MRSGSRGAALTATDYLGLAQLAAAVGRDDEARRWLAQAETFWAESPDELTMAAATHAMLGEPDEAIRKLRRALEGPIQDPYLPLVLPPFHGLLDDSRFLALFGVDEIV